MALIYKHIVFSILTTCISSISSASACSEWLKNKTADYPVCPEGGGLVPETYPVGAVVVSDQGYGWTKNSKFPSDVVEKVIKNAGKNAPLFVLPVSDDTMARIQDRIDHLPIHKNEKEKYKKLLLQVKTDSYPWQQDYMQPFVGNNGQITLKEVEKYDRNGDNFEKISEAVKECGIFTGPKLKTDSKDGGYMGGNIDTLPGGICLLGDDSFKNSEVWEKYSDQFCDKDFQNRIKVPTSWLKIGHTDEIIKVVRNNKAAAPCNFTVTVASPKKAFDLMKAHPNNKFIAFQPQPEEDIKKMTRRRLNQDSGLSLICQNYFSYQKSQNKKQKKSSPVKAISKIMDLKNLLIKQVFAGYYIGGYVIGRDTDCSHITNSDAYEVISQDEDLKMFNDLIQEKMELLKVDIKGKLKGKFPNCKIDVLDVPDIFYGGIPVKLVSGDAALPYGMARSLFPNPTNSISINDSVISPEPVNSSFKRYLTEEYKRRGLQADFVDTFDYAHQGDGNLHCATTTIHMCKPRGAK